MSARTRSASLAASAAPRPAVSTGASAVTVAVVGANTSECLGSAFSVPRIASGTTSTPFDSAKKSWGMPISRDAERRLRAALARGPVTLRVKTATKMYPSDELTLVAEVHGAVAANERFVLSAHVQEPGANDNASGVGDLSEMARVLGDER